MTKKVYFVRHGQSRGNVDGVFHGPEVPLTKHGEEQARFVAARCKGLHPEVIISSTMERARQTGGFIAEATGAPIEYSDDFVERLDPSSLRDQSGADPLVDALHKRWTESFFAHNVRIEDGENFEDIRDRAKRALKHIEERAEERIVAVTHGFFLRMIVAYITSGDSLTPEGFKDFLLAFRTTNTGITFIQSGSDDIWHPWMGSRTWIIRAWNDYAHLGDSHSKHE